MRRLRKASGLPNRRRSLRATASASAMPSNGDTLGVAAAVDHRRSARLAQAGVDRQAEDGARVQFEFGEALRAQRHQPGVVRARADFGEPHLIALDEQFDAEEAAPAEVAGDGGGDVARLLQSDRRSSPAAARIRRSRRQPAGGRSVRRTRCSTAPPAPTCAHGEQGDLVVEVDQAFDDHPPLVDPPAARRVVPGRRTSAGPRSSDCPLPEDDITGLTMHG
jgi:hypothetical protein